MNANLRIDPRDRKLAELEKRVAALEEVVEIAVGLLQEMAEEDLRQAEILTRLSSKIAVQEGD